MKNKNILSGILAYASVYFLFVFLLLEKSAHAAVILVGAETTTFSISLAEVVLGVTATVLTILLGIVGYFLVSTLNRFENSVLSVGTKLDSMNTEIANQRGDIKNHEGRITRIEKAE